MKRSAVISDDGLYRYSLTRDWSGLDPLNRGYVNFIGLNPSTADAEVDDATIRRLIAFTRDWGYDQLMVTNLFAFRATNPLDMKNSDDPIGYENSHYIVETAKKAELVIACWGAHGEYGSRNEVVMNLLRYSEIKLSYMHMTKHGHPGHPLYLPKSTELKYF